MLPFGLGASAVVSLAGFALTGLIWSPHMSTSMALFQGSTPVAKLPEVLAANGAIIVMAVPLGTMLGGPVVTALGPRTTLLLCATTTIAVGLAARLAPSSPDGDAHGPQHPAAGHRHRSHRPTPSRTLPPKTSSHSPSTHDTATKRQYLCSRNLGPDGALRPTPEFQKSS